PRVILSEPFSFRVFAGERRSARSSARNATRSLTCCPSTSTMRNRAPSATGNAWPLAALTSTSSFMCSSARVPRDLARALYRPVASRLASPGHQPPLDDADDAIEADPGEAHDDVAHEDDIGSEKFRRVEHHPPDPRGRRDHLGGDERRVGEPDAH